MMKYGVRPKATAKVTKWKRPSPLPEVTRFHPLTPNENPSTGLGAAGPGPYFIQGWKASDLEWRVYRMLKKLKWAESQIDFQAAVFGGFRVPGGQSLDFVLYGYGGQTVIPVNGEYWHAHSLAQKERDRQNEAFVKRVRPLAKFIPLYSADIATDEMAYARLLREVGRGG